MAEEEIIGAISGEVGQFHSVSQLIASSTSIQIAFAVLVIGIIVICTVYHKFSKWTHRQSFSYRRPHVSRLVQAAVLPFFAIALVSSVNVYIQVFELFAELSEEELSAGVLSPAETFAKILNTLNILVIGYTIAHIISIILDKREKSILELEDFENWKEKKGFTDDGGIYFTSYTSGCLPQKHPKKLMRMNSKNICKQMRVENYLKTLERRLAHRLEATRPSQMVLLKNGKNQKGPSMQSITNLA